MLRCLLSVWCVVLSATPAMSQSTAAEWFAEAGRLFQTGGFAANRNALERTVEAALKEQNRQIEADAGFYLGQGLNTIANYPASNTQFETALRLYQELGNTSRAASVKTFLASNAVEIGNRGQARAYYLEALAAYESLNDLNAVADLHYSLAFVA